jgi:membrane peptidoglycan carboxypeptidase
MQGQEVLPPHDAPRGDRAISEQAAFVVTDILAGNTDPAVNPLWAAHRITTPGGQRRPAAFKTGTTNDAKDLNAYGYIAPPTARGRARGEYALSVGVWAGNSDSSPVTTVANPVFSLDVAAPIWDAFLSEVTRGWEVRDFTRPDGLSTASVDVFTGHEPSRWSREQTVEYFLRGTSPGEDPYLRGVQVLRGPDGGTYLWEEGCEGQPRTRGYLALDDAESAYPSWNAAVRGWLKRARRGAGVGADVSSAKRTYTAYFYGPSFQPYGQSWGGSFAPTRSCRLAPSASPSASPSPSPSASVSPGPSPSTEASPSAPPQETPAPTPKPTKKPRPSPTAEVTPAPTPGPTPEPSAPASNAPAGGSPQAPGSPPPSS